MVGVTTILYCDDVWMEKERCMSYSEKLYIHQVISYLIVSGFGPPHLCKTHYKPFPCSIPEDFFDPIDVPVY